ncbi:hypothetical protein BRARA_E02224 [Brassica rapa]|uniref:Uncharacterized protein n=1 Tax=Brassica campestris TaxID=3711 RepID=A0A397ZC20_BRACM|nr:hypothetical protein BRARA_E02224 [Brassica rapa]
MGDEAGPDIHESSQGENVLKFMLSEMLADHLEDESAFQTRTKKIIEQFFSQSSDPMTSVFHTMKVLKNLSGVRMWSPLYISSIAHIQADVTRREAFLAFPDPENKVCYLAFKTGKKRDE